MDHYKNQELTVTIEDISDNGEGIGRSDGYILFVKDAFPKDTVRVKLTKVKKNYAYARCEEIIKASPDRTEPACPDHRRCGGCQIQAMSYESQLSFKENKVRNDLVRIGGIPKEEVDKIFEPIIGMEEPFRYRNKSQYPIGFSSDGNIVAGFFAGRTHTIIPRTDCLLAPAEDQAILDIILEHMKKYGISPYDESSGSGTLRHVLIRKGFATGQIMVCFVIKHDGKKTHKVFVPGQEDLIGKLSLIEGMTSICVSINNKNTNVIMGNEIHVIWGKESIEDVILNKRFEISPLSFYQVNPVQVEKLYSTAIEYASLSGTEEVWDICCGIGTISICMADSAKTVHGLEIVPEAIEDAKKNAVANNTGNVDFICDAAEEYLPEHMDEIKADVIVLDPPRKGMDEKALIVIAGAQPSRIVYVSCDSATLARDLKFLTSQGYEIKRIRCVDMFPQTIHIETCVLLGRETDRDIKYEYIDYIPKDNPLEKKRAR